MRRLLEDHVSVSEWAETMELLSHVSATEDRANWFDKVEKFFKMEILGHFRYEEEVVFPSVLVSNPTDDVISLVLELQKEHGIIQSEFVHFMDDFISNGVTDNRARYRKARKKAQYIIERLLAHSAKEDDRLVPYLMDHREAILIQAI